jgi:hypothetical protein
MPLSFSSNPTLGVVRRNPLFAITNASQVSRTHMRPHRPDFGCLIQITEKYVAK